MDWLKLAETGWDFITKRFPGILKQHLVWTICGSIVFVVIIELIPLNPWLGSPNAKAALIKFMINDADEYRTVVERLSANNSSSFFLFKKGAAQAGFFTSSDPALIHEWEYQSQKLAWDAPDLAPSALHDARERAELLQAPFQIIGRPAFVSSPDCLRDRPGFGKVYINQRRQLGRLFKPGDMIKIINLTGGGLPVVASIELPDRKMPDGVDLYLNKYEMEKMLGKLSAAAEVRVSMTPAKAPNQVTDDDKPDQVVKCDRPNVR